MTRGKAHLIIACLALMASANYIPSKLALSVLDPVTLVAYRFATGAILTFLLFPRRSLALRGRELRGGAVTGAFFGAGLVPLFLALRISHSGVTAFLVGGCALFVPFFEFVAMRRVPGRFQAIGLTIGLCGMSLLTVKEGMVIDAGSFWGLLSAMLFAVWAVSLSYFGRGVDPLGLGLAQIYTVAIGFTALSVVSGSLTLSLPTSIWLAIAYLGVFGVSIRFLVQSHVQVYTTATNVEIIFLLEPLFAFIWAAVVAGESATGRQLAGCTVIVAGILAAQWGDLRATFFAAAPRGGAAA